MKQVKVNDILYVMDTEAYQITADTDASIIYVPEDHYDEYVAAQWPQDELITGDEVARIQGVISKMQKYNYNCIVVNVPDYVIEKEKQEREAAYKVITKYVTTEDNKSVQLFGFYAAPNYDAIEIDGENIDMSNFGNFSVNYTIPTAGEHTIIYTLKDPTYIPESSFEGCELMTDIIIPNLIEKTYTRSFKDCEKITSINIPDSVTEIGQETFSNCVGIEEIQLSKNLNLIREFAFSYCQFPSIMIPKSVTKINNGAFKNTPTAIIMESETPCEIGDDVFWDVTAIYVPANSVDIYKAAENWSYHAEIIQAIPTA